LSFYVKKNGWQGLADDRNARACILVDINAGGNRYCFSTIDVDVQSAADGPWMRFHGAIMNDPVHKEKVDVFGRQPSVQDMKFTVMSERFPIPEMRRTGLLLQDIRVDVYWHIIGRDFTFDQAFHLLRGRLQDPTYNEQEKTVDFRVEDTRLEGEQRFPPVVADQTKIPNLIDDHVGKPYPIVIGSCKKSPVLNIDGAIAGNVFLAMGDPMDEYAGGAQVSEVYDQDTALTVSAQTRQTDAEGNVYHRVTTNDNAATAEVTADVTGHANTDVESVIRYLLTFFANNDDVFDLSSLKQVKLAMPKVDLGMVFNSRSSRGGVLKVLIDRVLRMLPIGMIPRGRKYEFKPLTWDRDVMHHLSFADGSIQECVSGPTETKRSDVFNEFVIRYNRSSLRGGKISVLEKTSSNNQDCRRSEERYGRRAMGDVDAGDLNSDDGAAWLMDWYVETYSRMRVFVSYRVNLGAVNVPLWATVRVEDEFQNWDSLFKVIGIRRGTGSDMVLDLVSIDDYSEVYKPIAPVVLSAEVIEDPWADWWWFDGVDDHLWLASNQDFEIDEGECSVIVGVRQEASGVAAVSTYGLYTKDGYPGGNNSWKLYTTHHGTFPAGNSRPVGFGVWRGAFGLQNAETGDMAHPFIDTVLAGRFKNSIDSSYRSIYDDTPQAINTYSFCFGSVTDDSSSRVRIAAHGHSSAPDYAQQFYKGRIYWALWVKGYRYTGGQLQQILDNAIKPYEICDPDTYPMCYIDFNDAVGATLTPDIASGPNAPYTWNVYSSPILNGP